VAKVIKDKVKNALEKISLESENINDNDRMGGKDFAPQNNSSDKEKRINQE
jgi:hypothetical protein